MKIFISKTARKMGQSISVSVDKKETLSPTRKNGAIKGNPAYLATMSPEVSPMSMSGGTITLSQADW